MSKTDHREVVISSARDAAAAADRLPPADSPARVRATTLTVRGSGPGAESIVPAFEPLRPLPAVAAGAGMPADMRERVEYGRLGSPLPYAVHDDYDRTTAAIDLPALELTNCVVTATVLPGLGGRVWSLYDESRGRELLHVNPLLRFANFGLTGAWFAGGIEWNLGSTGHSSLSSRPVHAGVLRRADGDVLRLWEWERTRDLVLQVDLTLSGDQLVASGRVLNPDPEDKPLYYWTNIAVPETAASRVLCPAAEAWRSDESGALTQVRMPFPDAPDIDVSRPMASEHSADYFYDVRDQTGRFLVAVEPDGHGFGQTSTAPLTGRKLFLWGAGSGGSRWQEWLSGPDARYCEIQAGACPTQLEHDRLIGHGVASWTESFGAIDLAPDVVAGDYERATTLAAAAMHDRQPAERLESHHRRWLHGVADAAPDEILAEGSGWGYAELLLRGPEPWPHRSALPFPRVADASAAAVALVQRDRFELERLAAGLPVPPVSDRWFELLRVQSGHWWTDLAAAVNHHLRGHHESAGAAYRRSVRARPTAGGLRGLALLAAAAGRVDEAATHYAAARRLEPGSRTLATEELTLLIEAGRPEDCLAVVEALPARLRGHGRTRLLEARALLALDRIDRAASILDDLEVEDLAEGGRELDRLWARVHPDRPLPRRLDFRMGDERSEQ